MSLKITKIATERAFLALLVRGYTLHHVEDYSLKFIGNDLYKRYIDPPKHRCTGWIPGCLPTVIIPQDWSVSTHRI